MNNKVKKYKDFLNEASNSNQRLPGRLLPSTDRQIYLTLRSEFKEDILDLEKFYITKFSNLCSGDHDPDKDYDELKSLMSKKGWDMESIKNLFSEKADSLCEYNFFDLSRSVAPKSLTKSSFTNKQWEVFQNPSLDEQNGYIDIYMFKLVEELGLKGGKIWLGGEGWADAMNYTNDGNEYLIKCAYGYHHTKYGQLFLKQVGISEEQLISKAIADFSEWFSGSWLSIISDGLSPGNSYKVRNSNYKFEDFCLIESDRIVIFSESISNELKSKEINVSPEEITSSILKKVGDLFRLDIEVINNDVIIWVESPGSH